jgi:hypothetical protein
MAVTTLKPSPRGKWEKAQASSNFWLFAIALFASNVLRHDVGFWGSLAIAVIIMGLGSLALGRKAGPERENRLARDVERGVIECALRYADALPGSLRSRWLPGFAEISGGTFKFQPDYTDMGEPEGKVAVYTDVVYRGFVELPPKRPAELKRNWEIVALGTDKGELHVATGEAGLDLFSQRL